MMPIMCQLSGSRLASRPISNIEGSIQESKVCVQAFGNAQLQPEFHFQLEIRILEYNYLSMRIYKVHCQRVKARRS